MALEAPLFMQGNTYAARRLRELVGYVFDTEGVVNLPTGALKVSPRAAGANMSVDIAAGTCAILGDDQAGQGMYLCPSTAVENKPIGAAPGSNSRIDLVYAKLRDAAVTGGTASDWIIEVLPGEVAAAPVEPALPPSAIRLAAVTIAAGTLSIDAAKITDRRTAATNAAYAAKAGATFTGRVGFDVGLVSARMRQAERFTGAAETTTQLGYQPLPTATEFDFVVPPSERGMVHLRADISNSGADFSFMGFEIFDVAGAVVTQAPSDDAALYQQGTSRAMLGIAVPIVLPAGSAGKTFRLRTRNRVTGGTGTFSRRQAAFVPSP